MLDNMHLCKKVKQLEADKVALVAQSEHLVGVNKQLSEVNEHLTVINANLYKSNDTLIADRNRRVQGLVDVLKYRKAMTEMSDEAEAALWGE